MTHRLPSNYAKNYCNRTLIAKVIVENVVTCFLGHGVEPHKSDKAIFWLRYVDYDFVSFSYLVLVTA